MDEPSDERSETDDELLQRSREGDRHAFSELWRRHSPVAVAYARSLGAAPPDPEDVVSDAFVSILRSMRVGKGPERSFRPYLLTTVRNTWMTHARRAPQTAPLDDDAHPESAIGTIDIEAMADSTTISQAFTSLPERWQHALWLSAVEQLPPRQIAAVLHIRPNSAAALTYRARDALRKAWIRAHLRAAPAGTEHARVIEMLGAYAHGDLPPTSERFVTAHLDACSACASAAGEARHLARAMTLGPLLAGGSGLVLAPALFPADQAAAVVSSIDAPTWATLSVSAQPAVEAAAHATPALWHVAAATAFALTVGGGLFALPTADTESAPLATAVSAPTPAPAGAVPGLRPVTDEDDTAAPRGETTPSSRPSDEHRDEGNGTDQKGPTAEDGRPGNDGSGHDGKGNAGNGKPGAADAALTAPGSVSGGATPADGNGNNGKGAGNGNNGKGAGNGNNGNGNGNGKPSPAASENNGRHNGVGNGVGATNSSKSGGGTPSRGDDRGDEG
ncbi:MAG: sigma-70 family RNA polymerase sigma factor [Microbacterium sp.]|nr:sigma-70 family RNA polymerase sigma factor [Microbacterium sp.]